MFDRLTARKRAKPYDASENYSLVKAWETLNNKVKKVVLEHRVEDGDLVSED